MGEEDGKALDRTHLEGMSPVGSYHFVKVGETGSKSCQQNLMKAEVTDVGHLARVRLGRKQAKAGQGQRRNTPIVPI